MSELRLSWSILRRAQDDIEAARPILRAMHDAFARIYVDVYRMLAECAGSTGITLGRIAQKRRG